MTSSICTTSKLLLPRPIRDHSYLDQYFTAVITVSLIIYTIPFLLFLAVKPKFTRLQFRSSLLVVLVILGFPWLLGVGDYPCAATMIFSLTVVPLIGCTYVCRQIQIFHMNRFAKATALYLQDLDAKSDEHHSFSDFVLLSTALKTLFTGYVDTDEHRSLYTSKYIMSRRGILTLAALLFAPAGVAIVAILLSDPVYTSGCTGCNVGLAVTVALVLEALAIISLGFISSFRARGIPDVWGLKTELKLLLFFSCFSIFFFILTQIIDNDILGLGVTIGVWGIVLSLTLFPVVMAFLFDSDQYDLLSRIAPQNRDDVNPGTEDTTLASAATATTTTDREEIDGEALANAVKAKDPRGRTGSMYSSLVRRVSRNAEFVRLEDVLADSEMAKAFEERLITEMGVESLYFYKEVLHWVKSYYSESEATRRARGKKLYKVYIDVTGLYSVNIPSSVYNRVTEKVKSDQFPREMFDEAKDEVVKLLERGALYRFSKSREYLAMKKSRRTLAATAAHP